MAKIYFRQVKAGTRTVDQVPTLWREAVQALLDAEQSE